MTQADEMHTPTTTILYVCKKHVDVRHTCTRLSHRTDAPLLAQPFDVLAASHVTQAAAFSKPAAQQHCCLPEWH
jgi:hypothetical protein